MEFFILALIGLLFILNNLMSVEARYCKFEFEGQFKYYACPRNEYCCNLGCCISPTFQFYQLWYYWLMVIFMFAVCSGGQWWYRYWVNNNGYLADLGSAMPGRGPPVGTMARDGAVNRNRGTAPPRSTRVAYHSATDAIIMQNVWKPPYSGRGNSSNSSGSSTIGPPPAYSQTSIHQPIGGSSSSGVAAPTSSPKRSSPYIQLYGPPPSYESVVGLSSLSAEQPQHPSPQQQPQQQQPTPPPPPAQPQQPPQQQQQPQQQIPAVHQHR